MNLRELFIQWLTGSQYLRHLEEELSTLRMDFSQRLNEKDIYIKSLRVELAGVKQEAERMRLVLMPLGSPAGQMYAAKFQTGPVKSDIGVQGSSPIRSDMALDWQGELNQMLKEEEHGIRSRGRIQINESPTDDGS